MNRSKKLVIGGAVLAALVGIAGTAYALWTSDAVGEGRATAQTAVDATVNPSGGSPDLYPGFTNGDLYFTIDNTNDYDIRYASMVADTIESSNEVACPSTNVTVDDVPSGLTLLSPANDETEQLTIANVVNMVEGAPDTCQGVSFDVALVLTGTQVDPTP